jgi:SAM-dependent methyltransferase
MLAMTPQISDTWERGDPYEQYVGRWSRRIAPAFLSWLDVAPNKKWLDVGCGTGALSAAILDHCSPASVDAIEPSEGFLKSAKAHLPAHVTFHQGSATTIPLPTASIDAVVSGFVLNFVQNPHAALAEMARVIRADGIIGAYVWDYADKAEIMRYFWDAAVALDRNARSLDEGRRFPLCRPQALRELFASANLREVEAQAIDIATYFANFADYWHPFTGAQGPAPAYAMALDESARQRLHDHLRQLVPTQADGSILLTGRAWAVRGTVSK